MPDTKLLILIAMVMFTIASMVTTYISLSISVLPEPSVVIPITEDVQWECAWLALLLAVGIGLMLFALKVAIIDDQKRLNLVGIAGLTVVAFISISFNMDVFYRAANRDFYIQHTSAEMKKLYADYLAEVDSILSGRRTELLRQVARQEGELESEIRGLREAPEGYGPMARQEDYQLTLLQRETEVELRALDEARAEREEANALLAQSAYDLGGVESIQDQLRVVAASMGAQAGVPLPEPYRARNQLFVVFAKLFDFRNSDFMDISMALLIMALAFLLDLGDIVGYSMVPDQPGSKRAARHPDYHSYTGPEIIPAPERRPLLTEPEHSPIDYYAEDEKEEFFARGGNREYPLPEEETEAESAQGHSRRPFRFRRRR